MLTKIKEMLGVVFSWINKNHMIASAFLTIFNPFPIVCFAFNTKNIIELAEDLVVKAGNSKQTD